MQRNINYIRLWLHRPRMLVGSCFIGFGVFLGFADSKKMLHSITGLIISKGQTANTSVLARFSTVGCEDLAFLLTIFLRSTPPK